MANTTQVLVPDIGGFKDVDVIDVLVKAGQEIDKETPMVTLETEKAAMDVPAPAAGRIAEVKVKKGDKVSEGSVILLLENTAQSAAAPDKPAAPEGAVLPEEAPAPRAAAPKSEAPAAATATDSVRPQAAASPSPAPRDAPPIDEKAFSTAYASPSVRKFARELGADLGKIKGTGPKGRITHEDVKAHVKRLLTSPAPAPAAAAMPTVAQVDFAKFGA